MTLPSKILKPIGYVFLTIILIYLYLYLANPLEITVTGTGTVTARADKATIILTLSDSFPDSETAANSFIATASSIRNYLVQQGVMPENIKENEINTIPVSGLDPSETGVRATKTLDVTLTDLSGINSLTPQFYKLGAKFVSQPDLTLTDKANWEEKAEEEALNDTESQVKIQMKKYRKFFKRISSISPVPSNSLVDSLNPITGQVLNPFQNQQENINNQTVSKSLIVTFKLW